MPIKDCKVDGKSGKKWGDSGKCYTGPDAEKKAQKQAQAAYAAGYKGEAMLLSIIEEVKNEFASGGCTRSMGDIKKLHKAMVKAIKKDGYVLVRDAEGTEISINSEDDIDLVYDTAFGITHDGDEMEVSVSCLEIV